MIIDGYAHIMTESIVRDMGIGLQKVPPQLAEMTKRSVKENVETWLSAMDKFGIEKTVFMATASLNKDFTEFINSSSRFVGFAKINPKPYEPVATITTLQKEFENGMKGVKLYATGDGFDVGCADMYPFYEYCQQNNVPIVIHFGVTIGMRSNLMAGNPLLLSRILKDFPKLNFVIAHFGAGFFREVLMLKYRTDNLFVDTSGTNNWIPYQDNFLILKDVFRKAIEIFGPQKIIFGSDTRIFPDGYRENILSEQIKILDELNLSSADKEDIMSNNARRVFNI